MEVSYHTRRADAWRFNLYILSASRPMVFLWIVMFAGGWVIGPLLFPGHSWAGGASAVAWVLLNVVANVVALWININRRFPRPDSTRACTTRLDTDGIQDTTPDGVNFIPWANVSSIRLFQGDVYFLTRAGRGFGISHSAFTSEAYAREYVEEARRFQRKVDPVPAQRLAFERGGVQSDTNTKRIKPQLTPGQQRRNTTVMAVFMTVILLAATVWGTTSWWTDSRRAAEFRQSPGCTASAPASSRFSPCTAQTLTVTRAWVVSHSKGPDDNNLTLQGPGISETVDIKYSLWERVGVGMPVQATLWRGKIVRVSAGGQTSRTWDNPETALRVDRQLVGICLFALALFAFSAWREKRKAAVAAPR